MTINQELRRQIEAKIRAYPTRPNHEIRSLFKRRNGNPIANSAVVAEIRAAMSGEEPTAPAPRKPRKVKTAAKTLDEFRRTYDKDTIIPAKVREALERLADGWQYESEFVRAAGVSYADLGNYRDMFADHIVTIRRDNKRVWAGTTALAAQLREMV